MSNPRVEHDIANYIDGKLNSEWVFQHWSPVLREEAKDALAKGANGMFRWVACQLEILKRLHLESAVRKALVQLPETLDETYERIFTSIPAESKQYVWRICVLLLSMSSVPMEVLVSFVSMNDSEDETMEETLSPEAILEMASCLITTTVDTITFDRKGKTSVRLAHYTIKEYLLAPRLTQTGASMFYLTESQALRYLVKLMLQVVQIGDSGIHDEFLKFTQQKWKEILAQADTAVASDRPLCTALFKGLDPQAAHYKRLIPHNSQLYTLGTMRYALPGEFPERSEVGILANMIYTGLYATVATFLLQYTPDEIARLCTTEAEGWGDIPMLCWLSRDHFDKHVLLLLNRSTEFQQKRNSLLLWAMESFDHLSNMNVTASTLVSAHVPVNPVGVRVTPLQIAVRRMRADDVRMLISNGADANAVGAIDGWAPRKLGHFQGGESPLFIIRQQRSWLQEGLLLNFSRDMMETVDKIETILLEAQAREFCEWSLGQKLDY